ncbi:peptide ABC transporter permease [Bacillus sp. V3-13]|uniref:ABC transporter permease n=1 Tax=Bacillus sp. V3-13 TaxID=2053728 RepID=UPI000C776960|nr:ABC transporter permease [Bacillus sp. V3-13]PLR75756.1 peptide ABC transporter permease [Bacillus sp. V3-13]
MRSFSIGMVLVCVPVLLMIIGIIHPPFDHEAMNVAHKLQPPSLNHWFGTDQYGRDILTRIMIASQNALLVSIGSVGLAMVIGCVLGASAGYFQGWYGSLIMRIMDGLFAFPGLLLALLIVTVLGVGGENAVIAIAIFNIPLFARLMYGFILEANSFGYVKAAHSYGANSSQIIFVHMVPSAFSKILVQGTTSMSGAILTEAALSFLGLGVQPPHPSWGGMLNEAQPLLAVAPWYPVFPGLIIFITVMGFNLIGDGWRDLQVKER